VRVEIDRTVGVIAAELDAPRITLGVIEGREDHRRAELPFVEQVLLDLVISVEAKLKAAVETLFDASVEIMLTFGLDRVVGLNLGLLGRPVVQGDRGRRDQLLRRRGEIARIAEMEGGQRGRVPDEIDARAELPLMRVGMHDIEARA